MMKTNKITLVTSSLTCGGAEKNVALLANEWAKRGADVSVISFDMHPPFFQLDAAVHLIKTDITRGYRRLWQDFWTAPVRLWKLRRVIAGTHPEIVISFMDINNLLTLLCTIGKAYPVMVAERSDPAIWPMQTGWRLLRSLLYPLATRIITQTEGAKLFFSHNLQLKIAVIPNPVPRPKEPLNLPAKLDSKKIVSIGRLVSMKRFDMLLEALSKLRPEFPEWSVDILGDGEERASLEQMTKDLGLSDIVRWRGTVKETASYLQNAALFVLCSDFEGFPNALTEALAAGIPSVVTDTQGARSLIQNHHNGVRVPVGDITILMAAMKEVMQNSHLRSQLSEQALKVTEDYSIENILKKWEAVLESV